MNLKITLSCLVLGVLMLSCKQSNTEKTVDPLPTFNKAKSKSEIIAFVSSVTDPSNPNFVEPKDRIVCFDNDGTLWAEQPLPSQIFFVFDKVKELAKTNPKYTTESPYKEVLANDIEGILKVDKAKTIAIIGEVDSLYHTDYDSTVNSWLKSAKHPILKRTYDKTVYQPMMELLDYLRENEFSIYIVSGGGTNFMRAWQPELYNIDKNYIVGSTFKTEAVHQEDSIAVLPTSEFDFYDDHMGKVISIQKEIGKKPIMVVGNSDGDLEMMEYSDTDNPHPTLMVYVLHSDGEREFLYSEKTPMGRLEKGWEVAQRKGWTIIDMKKDWKEVFVE